MKFNRKRVWSVLIGVIGFSVLSFFINMWSDVQAIIPTGLAQVDVVFGNAEKVANRTISGGYRVGFNYPCQGQNCSHIEFQNNPAINGMQWVSGDDQFVSGGGGCLGGVNGGKEPTGRHPYGSAFKVVLRNLNEQNDTAEVWQYKRFCSWCGCSPYSVPVIKLATWRVGETVFVGE